MTPAPTFEQRVAFLKRQIDVLQAQEATGCPERYGALAQERDLHVAMFWGYGEYLGVMVDEVFAKAMAAALELPCHGTMVACGFARDGDEKNLIRLRRTLDDRAVSVDISWTSISNDHGYNRGEGFEAQKEQSGVTKERFYRALREADVVFFNGHSRWGGGLGFDPSTRADIVIDRLTREKANAITSALSARPSRLKLFSVTSCQSDAYYEDAFQKAAPDVSLIMAKTDISANQSDQVNLGVLNAILGRRCSREWSASMRSVDVPDGAELKYLAR